MNAVAVLDEALARAKANGFSRPWRPDVEMSNTLIYEPDFMKALFGELPYYPIEGGTCGVDCDYCNNRLANWQYHAQQMVIASNPIKYLEWFLHGTDDDSFDDIV